MQHRQAKSTRGYFVRNDLEQRSIRFLCNGGDPFWYAPEILFTNHEVNIGIKIIRQALISGQYAIALTLLCKFIQQQASYE
jgi:hypothetical protein